MRRRDGWWRRCCSARRRRCGCGSANPYAQTRRRDPVVVPTPLSPSGTVPGDGESSDDQPQRRRADDELANGRARAT